ncbi:hypothetical protein NDU88_000752 [Pleurodeles waltl]|uniref:Uncharacterized protein n=1 Tax=Pleurodeles waltl TaxID=8319 RepID=A0AAV7Q878_PLEWA|nr:hypothetical protein NDU88_000752 [Pleurodeles waltl]
MLTTSRQPVSHRSIARTEVPREKLFTLIRRRQAGLSVEDTKYKPVVDRKGRKWSGITRIVTPGTVAGNGSNNHDTDSMADDGTANHDTAFITTAKTGLAHLSVVDARDAAHMVSATGACEQNAWPETLVGARFRIFGKLAFGAYYGTQSTLDQTHAFGSQYFLPIREIEQLAAEGTEMLKYHGHRFFCRGPL